MYFTEEVLLTLHSYALHLNLNNEKLNMRHEGEKNKWICQHKDEMV